MRVKKNGVTVSSTSIYLDELKLMMSTSIGGSGGGGADSIGASASSLLIQPLISDEATSNKKWTNEEKRSWIFALFAGAMMLFSVRTVMSVCALEISKEFNYDKNQIATLLSSFFYGYPITQVPGGYLSDRIGGDLMIYYAGIFWASTTFLLPFVSLLSDDKYYILFYITLFRCLTGAFQGFHYPGTSSLVSKKVAESEKAFTFSFITSGQHLGTLFCGIIGSVILESYGWRYTFQLIGILSLVWVFYYRNNVLLWSRAKMSLLNAKDSVINPEDPLQLNPTMLNPNLSPLPSSASKVPWMEILNKPSFWSLIVAHEVKHKV